MTALVYLLNSMCRVGLSALGVFTELSGARSAGSVLCSGAYERKAANSGTASGFGHAHQRVLQVPQRRTPSC